MDLKLEHLGAPVTALQFVSDFLLTGEGPYVSVYHTASSHRLLFRSCVLKYSNVHGIRAGYSENGFQHICVFGGKSLRILQFDKRSGSLSFVTDVVEFEDWIWDVCWLKDTYSDTADSSMGIALAHNKVLQWRWTDGNILNVASCTEKCILYSALLIGCVWKDLVLVAGTVFQQVVIWPVCGRARVDGLNQVLTRLSGHQGVIFSIHYNASLSRLCSVSDDRSIRLWQLTAGDRLSQDTAEASTDSVNISPPDDTTVCEATTKTRTESDNALHAGHVSLTQWENMKYELVSVLYGHTSRVWDAVITTDYVVSISEDASCCVWDNTGKVVQKFKGHKGKNIWSLALNREENLIATGGGDTAVHLWELNPSRLQSQLAVCTMSLPAQKDQTEDLHVHVDDFPRIVAFLHHDEVLVMTDRGVLYKVKDETWSIIQDDSAFRSYSVLSVSPDSNIIAVGNISGLLRFISEDGKQLIEKQIYSSKILSLVWIEDLVLAVCGPDGKMDLYQIESKSSGFGLEQLVTFNLPYSKQRWIACGAMLRDHSLFVCGDRGGSVHIYDLCQETKEPVQSFPKLHGKAGVTSMCCHDNHIYSAGRDGQYRIFEIEDQEISLLNSNKVFKGFEWISRLMFTEEDLLILGFHTDQFIVWSVNTNQKLIQIQCGGGHRAWDFVLDGDIASFVYIKSRDISLCRTEITRTHPVLKESLHGRELTSCKYLFSLATSEKEGRKMNICVTSSEDTTINILSLFNIGGNHFIKVLARLGGHISSVRTLAVIESTNQNTETKATQQPCRSALLFSAGGRAQIKCWKLYFHQSEHTNQTVSSGEYCDSADREQTESGDQMKCTYKLLTTHMLGYKGKRNKKPWKTHDYDPSPETRYMAVTVFRLQELDPRAECDVCVMAAACSDGYVRLFVFEEQENLLSLVAHSGYHNHCVLCISHLIITHSDDSRALIMSAATDGQIAFWDVTSFLRDYMSRTMKCPRVKSNFDKSECGVKTSSSESGDSHITVSDTIHSSENSDTLLCQKSLDGLNSSASVSDEVSSCEQDGIDFCSQKGDKNKVFKTKVMYQSQSHVTGSAANDTQDLGTPCHVIRAHQSGINAIHVKHIKDDMYTLASGGDDNALLVHQLAIRASPSGTCYVNQVALYRNLCAHAAQITGCCVLNDVTVVTVSIDHRLSVWTVPSSPEEKLQLISSKFVSIANIAGMDFLQCGDEDEEAKVLICGEGLQQVSLST